MPLRYGLAAARLRPGHFDAALGSSRALGAEVRHPMIAARSAADPSAGPITMTGDRSLSQAALERYPTICGSSSTTAGLIKAGRPAEAARGLLSDLGTLRGNASCTGSPQGIRRRRSARWPRITS